MKIRNFALSLTIVLGALAANAAGGYKAITDTIHSAVLNAPRAYTAIVPQAYFTNPEARFPMV